MGPATANRLLALDWMRGIVMVLMVIDHAGFFFDVNHVAADSAILYRDQPLPLDHFLTRFISHLCAPSFVFLAGTALALSIERRKERVSALAIDRHLLIRGSILIVLELTVVSVSWWFNNPPMLVFQVLFAIGSGMILMIGLRRASSRQLMLLALVLVLGCEAVARMNGGLIGWTPDT